MVVPTWRINESDGTITIALKREPTDGATTVRYSVTGKGGADSVVVNEEPRDIEFADGSGTKLLNIELNDDSVNKSLTIHFGNNLNRKDKN